MKKLLIALIICGGFVLAAPALAADGAISGTVTHAIDGTPIESMTVLAQNVATDDTAYDTTAADGTYSITVAPGTYDVTTYTYSAVETEIYFIQKTYTVVVGSGDTVTRNIALTRRGRFIGHVYESDGVTEIQGATIYFTNESGYQYGSGGDESLSNGHYTVTPTPNDYSLSATGTYTMSVTKAGYFGTTVTNVVLTGDDRTITKNVELTPGSTVSGTVRNAAGHGIASATVTLTKGWNQVYTAVTRASGAYTVTIYDYNNSIGSAIGDYTITVNKDGYVQKTGDASITAEDSSLTGKNFSLVRAGKVKGTIKNSSGHALAGVSLTATDGFGHTYYATSGTNGKYTLSALKPSKNYEITATKTYYVGQKDYDVAVSSGQTTSGVNFTLPAAKTFSGTIKTTAGVPLEGAVVNLYKRNKSRSNYEDLSVTTKSDGAFRFKTVSPGLYRLDITLNGYVTYQQENLKLTSNVTGARYKLELGGKISGRVLNGSRGVAGAIIGIYAPTNGKEISYTYATTDENGRYLVTGLKSATYRLQINSAEFVATSVSVKVTAGQKTSQNIKLARAGSVSGYVVDRVTGLPVSVLVKVVGTTVSAWSDSNGFFILDGIAAGTCRVVVISQYYDIPGQLSVRVAVGTVTKNVNFSLNPKQ